MMRVKSLAITITLALALGGCASLQNFFHSVGLVTNATLSPQTVTVAVDSFHIVEVSAGNYLIAYASWPKCTGANGPLCRNQAVRKAVEKAVHDGQVARDGLIAFAQGHPGPLGVQGLVDAITVATKTLQAILPAV
jgi:hypothetical protein